MAALHSRFAEKNPLIAAILNGERERALELVRQDPAAAASATCCRGFSALFAATVADDGELIEELVRAGADVLAKLPEGHTWQVGHPLTLQSLHGD